MIFLHRDAARSTREHRPNDIFARFLCQGGCARNANHPTTLDDERAETPPHPAAYTAVSPAPAAILCFQSTAVVVDVLGYDAIGLRKAVGTAVVDETMIRGEYDQFLIPDEGKHSSRRCARMGTDGDHCRLMPCLATFTECIAGTSRDTSQSLEH